MNLRRNFYANVRQSLFGGKLTDQQVTTMDLMFDYWETNLNGYPTTWLAYTFATAYHETARTFGPIREFGRGKGKKYPPYYGRGLVQLTWDYNYKRMAKILELPLYEQPDLALDVANAVKIIFIGMQNGTFTGKAYKDYLTEHRTDYYNARRIINGLDKAKPIAGIAKQFETALRA